MKKTEERDEFLRKRAERQKKIRKRRLRVFFAVFTVMLLCIGVLLSLTVFFPIEKITASGSVIYTEEQLLKASGVNLGDNLFLVSVNQITERLKEKLPYVESVKLKRELPNTLKITVADAEEFACYSLKDEYFIVSESGWVLSRSAYEPENLFTVYGADVKCSVGSCMEIGEKMHTELVNSISAASKSAGVTLNAIDLTSRTEIILKADGRFQVNLGTTNDIEDKIKHLAAMIENIPAEKSGRINLSMWSKNNTQGTFAESGAE